MSPNSHYNNKNKNTNKNNNHNPQQINSQIYSHTKFGQIKNQVQKHSSPWFPQKPDKDPQTLHVANCRKHYHSQREVAVASACFAGVKKSIFLVL